ncbi:MAG: hypothetical protein QME12_04205 [Nanoarchaeota archaeon]|nr:hypothetical protein [Nanoarchaeota archaeon]
MEKVMILTAVVMGCSMPAALPAPCHQPAVWNPPAITSREPGNNNSFLSCETRMDTWGYILACDDGLVNITLDHSEWAPGSAAYDGKCNERMYYKTEAEKAKWIDYRCDEILDAFMDWAIVQTPPYIYDRLDVMSSPAQDYKPLFNMFKALIRADKADSAWRFRYHVPPRDGQ